MLKIEEGKYYRAVNGDKVGPMVKWNNNLPEAIHPWQSGPDVRYDYHKGGDIWRTDGTSFYGMPTLVAEWVDVD